MDRYVIELPDGEHTVELTGEGAELSATVDGRTYSLQSLAVGRDALSLLAGEKSYFAHVASGPEREISVKLRGQRFAPRVHTEREWHFRSLGGSGADAGAAGTLKAPMPGKVLEVRVAPGDAVEKGQALVVLEAMKMENELRAAGAGVVERVAVEAGEAVEKDAELVVVTLGDA